MPQHEVASTPDLPVAGMDPHYEAKEDGQVRATLPVTPGRLPWPPRSNHKMNGLPVSWQEFDDWVPGS